MMYANLSYQINNYRVSLGQDLAGLICLVDDGQKLEGGLELGVVCGVRMFRYHLVEQHRYVLLYPSNQHLQHVNNSARSTVPRGQFLLSAHTGSRVQWAFHQDV